MKILLVEDDRATRTLLEQALAVHHTVEMALDGRSALALAAQGHYDLLLLDVGIPHLDGISVCQQLRRQGYQLPILLLTAKAEADDRVLGLDAGADDYMVKPFHVPELLARIRALLRRSRARLTSIVTWGPLHLDSQIQEIHYGNQLLRLTPKEYGILELMLLQPQRIFSRTIIFDRLWELDEPPTESAITSHIKAIRQKLKAAGAQQDLIETVYGFGYRLRPAPPEATRPTIDAVTKPQPDKAEPPDEMVDSETAAAVMAELWERFQSSFMTQLDLLDRGIVALQNGTLTADLHQEVNQTVHKLVGSLGVYGFPQGSVLAKQIEELLRSNQMLNALEIQQLVTWMAELRQVLHQPPIAPTACDYAASHPPLVLVIDDDEQLTQRLQLDAQTRSLRLITATDPIAAAAMLDHTQPDVILLDLTFSQSHADGLNWLEHCKQVHPHIPVLVLTAHDTLADRLAASRLGAEQFLHKPATTEQIFHAIAQVLPQSQGGSQARILMVDDDPGVLTLLATLLSPWGLEVIALSEPQRFWEVLVATSPHLVLLDLEMPQVSGLELCRVVRQDAEWGNLPILVVTAHTDADSLQQAFAAGADDFITKPVIGPELVTRVLSRIERHRLHQRLEHPNSA